MKEMRFIDKKITTTELKQMADKNMFKLIKAVVDVERRVMVVDAEMHADEEKWLLGNGSKQSNLWGINLYPQNYGKEEFIEYDSMINLRPNDNNLTRGVDEPKIRGLIKEIVDELVANE